MSGAPPENEMGTPTDQPAALRQRLLAAVGPVLGLTLLLMAALILHNEFRAYNLDDVLRHLHSIPTDRLLLALVLTGIGYVVLTGYDALAFRYVGRPLRYRRIAFSSFVAFVFSYNIGLSFFGGGAVRYRMLSAWNVRADDIGRVIGFTLLTFWMGFFLVGGVVHTFWPIPVPLPALSLSSSRPIGIILLALTAGYVALTVIRREPFVLHGFRIDWPRPLITAAQFAISSIDWLIAGAVLYSVLPVAPGLDFSMFIGAYLLAQLVGLVSHVPGGLGVFETAMVLLLKPWLPGDEVLASILAYRVIYYLLPMVVAITLFAGYEIRARRTVVEQASAWLQGWMAEVVPRIFAVTIFLCGTLLLISGATPEIPDRFLWLRRAVPLPLLEVSKLVGSMIGVGLLVLANALRQRLDAAYLGTLALLVSGAIVSLVKGLDWEEASALTLMAVLLLPCRHYFYRQSSLMRQSLSPGWWLSVAVVAIGAIAAVDLSYRHVEYSNELWWRFDHAAEAPRSLRATLAAGIVLLTLGATRLLRPAQPAPRSPTREEMDRAQQIAVSSPRTSAYLALVGDKEILFHESKKAFLMYGMSGRTWISMGDPVGRETDREELAWRFKELADQHGARAVFYEVTEQMLPVYLDLGLDLLKLGEEGRVALQDFSLEGSARKRLRQSQNRATREGCHFEVVPAHGVPALLDELEGISNAWLADKSAQEKRFSLGCFDREYLARLPMAVVRKEERIVAFANLWPSDSRVELSIDLMRYDNSAPPGVMEYLFTQLMLWGKSEGYQFYSLGMAPLSGFEHHRLAPLWNRLGALLFRHGEHFYNFQGLRNFKEKFDPEWEPRYLATPTGLTSPLVLTRVAALISGSLTGILKR